MWGGPLHRGQGKLLLQHFVPLAWPQLTAAEPCWLPRLLLFTLFSAANQPQTLQREQLLCALTSHLSLWWLWVKRPSLQTMWDRVFIHLLVYMCVGMHAEVTRCCPSVTIYLRFERGSLTAQDLAQQAEPAVCSAIPEICEAPPPRGWECTHRLPCLVTRVLHSKYRHYWMDCSPAHNARFIPVHV